MTIYGAKGLAYIKVNDVAQGREGLQSPILKFLPDDAVDGILERTGAQSGDLIFFGADKARVVNEALGALRVKLGEDRGLMEGEWKPLWVVDFPMFEWADDRWHALHHPFTAPKESDLDKLDSDPGSCLSRAYDMVLNGTEVGGGSIRIFREFVQEKVFKLLGIGERHLGMRVLEEAAEKAEREEAVAEASLPAGVEEGVSWERTSRHLPGEDPASWAPSLDPRGGTPGDRGADIAVGWSGGSQPLVALAGRAAPEVSVEGLFASPTGSGSRPDGRDRALTASV